MLDPDALTIGFARRFATYKRAALLLRDIERLEQILNQTERPVQILFAGKAHPRDDAGKALIQQVVKLAQQKQFRRRVVFLEDYDMAVARYLVQGSDIWLNTPLRPMEASGTSGMKALANGGLNLSTLDGWWDEAWHTAAAEKRFIGWSIGSGESYASADEQDQVESAALYALLERDIVPSFYERGADGLPRRWIGQMKSSISTLCPTFNMQRMVKQYAADFYVMADERSQQLAANGAERARTLAAWTSHVQAQWKNVRVVSVESPAQTDLPVGSRLQVRAHLQLGGSGSRSGRGGTLRGKARRRWRVDRCLRHSDAGCRRRRRQPDLRSGHGAVSEERSARLYRTGHTRITRTSRRPFCRARSPGQGTG